MNKDGKLSLAVKCGLQMRKIPTMAIKKQLENMVFLLNQNDLQSFYCAI